MADRSSRHALPALTSTLHDPDGNYVDALIERGHALCWYRSVYVCATEPTDRRLIDLLQDLGATVVLQPVNTPGAARKLSVQLALAAGHCAFHYCDFDRWLHWVGRFPAELAGLPARVAGMAPAPWYVCLGRTDRAFDTHPEVQRVAERATSRALELVIGMPVDATAGSCWLSREGAEIVIAHSKEGTMGTDLEWPALIWQRDPDCLAMIETEGLEFESVEFAGAMIAAAGGEAAWIESTYQQPAMWQTRIQLAADSIAALHRVIQTPVSEDVPHDSVGAGVS